MKLVNTHVMNVKDIGNVLENFMMYNSRMDAQPYGYSHFHHNTFSLLINTSKIQSYILYDMTNTTCMLATLLKTKNKNTNYNI